MGYDSHLPLKKSGQSVIDRNLPYRFLRGQPLKGLIHCGGAISVTERTCRAPRRWSVTYRIGFVLYFGAV